MRASHEKIFQFAALLFFMAASSCHHHSNKNNSDMENIVTITGTAQNGKGSALLITATEEVYYIDILPSWDSPYFGKKVIVTGVLKEELFEEKDLKNEKGEWIQGMTGKKSTILRASWKLAEK